MFFTLLLNFLDTCITYRIIDYEYIIYKFFIFIIINNIIIYPFYIFLTRQIN